MSVTSSDSESSCGWIIISNEGSDIETSSSEAAVDYASELSVGGLPVEEPELQDKPASPSAAERVEARTADSLNDSQQIIVDKLNAGETGGYTAAKQQAPVLSSSDHSDIMTLGDLKEDEQVEREQRAAVNEEFYLGTPCSSQYTFSAADTVVPLQLPAVMISSSSEDEAGPSGSTGVRKRRLRKTTISVLTEPEEDTLESGQSEDGEENEDEGQQEEEQEIVKPDAGLGVQGGVGSILNNCILIALVVAISMGFGHFHGTVQIQERLKSVDRFRGNDLDGVRDLLQPLVDQMVDVTLDDLDENTVISLLTEVLQKMKEENQELSIRQTHIKAQRDELEMLLKQNDEERTDMASQQQRLVADNQMLRSSQERKDKSISSLREERRILHSRVGVSVVMLISKNQKLREQLEKHKQLIGSFHCRREDMIPPALKQMLNKKKEVTSKPRREVPVPGCVPADGQEAGSEFEALESRLMELDKRLSLEQQRSNMWEKLYVEGKEERAKGDTESKVNRPKPCVAGKMKETFEAVKNSTKDFVHHHKEQIKKAKESVKENLRKFSDSVKSTFRNFKDSASTFIHKARRFYDESSEKDAKESWRRGPHKPQHKPSHRPDDAFRSNRNTRKSGGTFQEERGRDGGKPKIKGYAGVFDCAYKESMSFFRRATEPIRADDFHQLLRSYLQKEVDHFHHWKDLETYVNNFFHNGLFIHNQMLFTDFVSDLKTFLGDFHEYHGFDEDVFEDLDDFVYRHFFGDAYPKVNRPHGPPERPDAEFKESRPKQQRSRPRPQSERKWSRSGRNADGQMADVKIELGPMQFDPKY